MKTMQMREFLRGGYKQISEMTLITNHGRPVATWMPQTDAKPRSAHLSMRHIHDVDSAHNASPEHGE